MLIYIPPPPAQQPNTGQVPRSQTTTHHSRAPLYKGSARHRDLYLTTRKSQETGTSMSPAEFEPAIPASERPETFVLDRSATGIGHPAKLQILDEHPVEEKAASMRMVNYAE